MELTITITWKWSGSKNKWLHSEIFSTGATTKMLFHHWRKCKKWWSVYHNKGIDLLNFGCTLLKLANICLHKSKKHNFFPFVEAFCSLNDKIREDITGGPSIVFTKKEVFDQTFIRNSEKLCKSIVVIDASQLYPFSMCQEMPIGLYTW